MNACDLRPSDQEYELLLPETARLPFAAAAVDEEDAAQRRLVERLLETTEELVLVLDPQGRILQINEAGRQISGYEAQAVLGRELWSALACGHDAAMFQAVFRQAQRQAQPLRLEAVLRTAAGQQKQVAWSFVAVRGSGATCHLVLVTGIDVTRRHQAEELVRTLKQQATVQATTDGADGKPAIVISERRTKPRRPFPYYQLLAPVLDGQLPRRQQFKHFRCIDIGPGGFAFLAPAPPTNDCFVVALGNPPNLVYLRAQVMHVRRLDSEGEQGYSVGCSYLDRVEI